MSDGEMVVHTRGEVLPVVKAFQASIQQRGDSVQKRRDFLGRLLLVAGLAATEQVISAASADASTLETAPSAEVALGAVHREIYSIGQDHMAPGADSSDLRGRALAAWRDAAAIRASGFKSSLTQNRAGIAEALSAGLVAQFWGDRGDEANAISWYRRAVAVTDDDSTLSWLYSCSAWVPLYNNVPHAAARQAAKGIDYSNWLSRERGMFAYGQMARALALDGNYGLARDMLAQANLNFLNSHGDHTRARPNVLHFTPSQHAQYMADTLSILAFSEDGRKSDIEKAEVHIKAAQVGRHGGPNGMNAVILEFARAKCVASGENADPDSAVEIGMNAISNTKRDDRSSAVVRGKAKQLSDDLSKKFNTRSVKGFVGFVDELIATAAA